MSALEAPVELQGFGCSVRGRALLQGLDLRLEAGSLCLLYGANGAGKSTLLKLLAGLLDGQSGVRLSGAGRVLGHPLRGRRGAQRARLGYMPQQGGLYEELSVAENLRFRAALLDLPAEGWRLADYLQQHGLGQVATQSLGRLSGGWRQRVAFAVAVLARPALLLLDEPSAGVDLEAKAQLWERIHAHAGQGATVLVSSHDSEDAAQCPRLLALQQGSIAYQGSAAALEAGHGSLQAGLRALLRAAGPPR